MSHDIRTPLNGIIGMTSAARGHVEEPGYMANCLDKISLAGGHLLMLVNDILDMSKKVKRCYEATVDALGRI